MRTYDPATHEDHNRPRREARALRIMYVCIAAMILNLIVDTPWHLDALLWVLTAVAFVGALVMLWAPWRAFGQPDDTEDDQEVYPS